MLTASEWNVYDRQNSLCICLYFLDSEIGCQSMNRIQNYKYGRNIKWKFVFNLEKLQTNYGEKTHCKQFCSVVFGNMTARIKGDYGWFFFPSLFRGGDNNNNSSRNWMKMWKSLLLIWKVWRQWICNKS